jgi:hypothetical protein
MAWNEDRRRAPSTSKVNDTENVRRSPQPTGYGNPFTAKIAAAYTDRSGDTRRARAKLRMADWRPDERLERLEGIVAAGSYTPSPGERVELGMYVAARQQVEDDANRYGVDAA